MTADWEHGGFGIYVHWPFCEAKCPYCDFNSHVSREIDTNRWIRAYISEIDRAATELSGRVVRTVYFGGGTPSLMPPEMVNAILSRIRHHWPTANDTEITLEANPSSVEAGRFRGYADAGVNRVSMGFQALNDRDLRRLGRIHTVDEAKRALSVAQSVFDRVSFDLIYARQDQTLQEWRAELTQALGMAVDHLSLYQLTIEDGTAFGDRYAKGGLKGLPIEDLAADMFELTQEVTAIHGFDAYEVSNHAKPGAESRHNLIYWNYGDYLGIGPGAHGRITLNGQRYATEATRNPNAWLDAADRGNAEKPRDALSRIEQANEYLLMGLRLSQGIDLDRLARLAGRHIDTDVVAQYCDIGLLETHLGYLRTTMQGRMVLNALLGELAFSPD